ncbi:LiaF transmembrane domain-containing protein [Dyadobacter tibetensis]|uniref:LiaF transmembrane domain-containing protein n=1 Tax=Dyadobacter tibetensis TaxID=1211851 RepID=UPI0004B59A43|nr:DUF5668 domain-containing protein [Dyadobacter tibetensis]
MRSSKNMVIGGMLLLLGVAWLLRNLGWLDLDWGYILPYWPILLILAGIISIFSQDNRGAAKAVVSLLIILAIVGGIANRKNWKYSDRRSWNRSWNGDNMPFLDEDELDEERLNKDEEYRRDRSLRENNPRKGYFSYDMESAINKATLNLEGGAGAFVLEESTNKLFEAHTSSSVVNFLSNKKTNLENNNTEISLKMEEGELSFKNGKVSNEAKIKLNTTPIWNIDMGIGAGKGDFDLSKFKVESVNISTGVANLDLRLGNLHDQVQVDVEAGVASIEIQVPRGMGCEVTLNGAMNSKSLKDFQKVDSDIFRTEGFDQTSQKVRIRFEGALTKVKVKRY